jgi:hypothetical protein
VHWVIFLLSITIRSSCPCKLFDEMGMLCSHVQALLLKMDETDTGDWVKWTHYRHQADTYTASYNATVPAMALAGRLVAHGNVMPPDYCKPPGRPKSRKDRSYLRSTGKTRVCKSCGSAGHMAKPCERPRTEFRYRKNKEKALEWCESMKMVIE